MPECSESLVPWVWLVSTPANSTEPLLEKGNIKERKAAQRSELNKGVSQNTEPLFLNNNDTDQETESVATKRIKKRMQRDEINGFFKRPIII